MSKVNQEQRAAIGWDVLTDVASKGDLISYGELGDRIGIHHRVVRFVLGLIQDYCLEQKLPPLTILVVNQSGLPGDGFVAWEVDDFEEGKHKVHNYNWKNEYNPFEYARDGQTEITIIDELLEDPNNSRDKYAQVKVRGVAQPIFRQVLLRAYDEQCAICGLTFTEALQAAHIKSWSHANKQERLDVRNGLLLCATHHSLFDNHYLTINDDFTVNYYDPDQEESYYSNYDGLLTTKLHGSKLKLPKNKSHWPSVEHLNWHRNEE